MSSLACVSIACAFRNPVTNRSRAVDVISVPPLGLPADHAASKIPQRRRALLVPDFAKVSGDLWRPKWRAVRHQPEREDTKRRELQPWRLLTKTTSQPSRRWQQRWPR